MGLVNMLIPTTRSETVYKIGYIRKLTVDILPTTANNIFITSSNLGKKITNIKVTAMAKMVTDLLTLKI